MADLVFCEDFSALKEIGAKLKSGGIIVAKHFGAAGEVETFRKKAGEGFKACHLMEKADHREPGLFRGKADFIAVRGGTPQLNNFAVSAKGVDFLLQPVDAGKLCFDSATARMAAENNVKVVFLFSEYLNAAPFRRMLLIKNSFMAARLMKRFGTKALFFSGAREANEMRSPMDMASFGVMLGFTREGALRFMKEFCKEALQ